MCTACCDALPEGGATVDLAILFADVRGSTNLGERTDVREYAALLNRFYKVATNVLVRHDAIIDKLIGDEVMALFVQGIAGPDYRKKSVSAAIDLVHAVHRDVLPIGRQYTRELPSSATSARAASSTSPRSVTP